MPEIVDIRDMHHLHVGIIQSPAFAAPAPRVHGIDLIPPDIHDAMRPGWYSGVHIARPITVDKVFDVYVTAEGLVFNHNHQVIRQTVTQHSPAEQDIALDQIRNTPDIPEIWTSCLLMRKRGEANYGHWMIEILPKLMLARKLTPVSGLALPNVGAGMNRVISDSLDIVEGDNEAVRLPLKANSVTFFKELILVSGMTEHGYYMSPLVFETIDHIRSAVAGSGPRRVFVSRRGAPRNVFNEDDLQGFLGDRAFDILHPGTLDFREQVSAFKDATCIMGVMGAGLTNMMFAQAGTTVINLAPATMPDTFFYLIASLRGHSYMEIRGANVNGGSSWDEAFSVDFQALESLTGPLLAR